jgi:hypothetical protein
MRDPALLESAKAETLALDRQNARVINAGERAAVEEIFKEFTPHAHKAFQKNRLIGRQVLGRMMTEYDVPRILLGNLYQDLSDIEAVQAEAHKRKAAENLDDKTFIQLGLLISQLANRRCSIINQITRTMQAIRDEEQRKVEPVSGRKHRNLPPDLSQSITVNVQSTAERIDIVEQRPPVSTCNPQEDAQSG